MFKKLNTTFFCVFLVLAIFCLLLWFVDPMQAWWMPKCWWLALTGTQCPACGTSRAVYAALHGHPVDALAFNPALPMLLGLSGAIVWLSLWRPSSPWIGRLAIILAIVAIAWWVLRNLI